MQQGQELRKKIERDQLKMADVSSDFNDKNQH